MDTAVKIPRVQVTEGQAFLSGQGAAIVRGFKLPAPSEMLIRQPDPPP